VAARAAPDPPPGGGHCAALFTTRDVTEAINPIWHQAPIDCDLGFSGLWCPFHFATYETFNEASVICVIEGELEPYRIAQTGPVMLWSDRIMEVEGIPDVFDCTLGRHDVDDRPPEAAQFRLQMEVAGMPPHTSGPFRRRRLR